MNLVGLGVLLHLALRNSPLAGLTECRDTITNELKMGHWVPADGTQSGDHGIVSSKDGVYWIDNMLVLARKLMYDGMGPQAQFVYSDGDEISDTSNTLFYYRDGQNGSGWETNASYALPAFDGTKDVLVKLEPGVDMTMKSFGVYCRVVKRPFAVVHLRKEAVSIPKPVDLGAFLEPDAESKTAGKVAAVSSQVFEISDFTFDHSKCAGKCWFAAGKTATPDAMADKLPTTDKVTADTKPSPIDKDYTAEKIRIKLEGDKGYCMYKWFGIYSETANKSLGHVMLPEAAIVPPEVGQNGMSWGMTTTTTELPPEPFTSSTPPTETGDVTTDDTTPDTTQQRTSILPPITILPSHANQMESAYGIILAAKTIIWYSIR